MLQMRSQLFRGRCCAVSFAIALACMPQRAAPVFAQASVDSDGAPGGPIRKSGYTLEGESCGQASSGAPFAFPKLRIGMRPGYCAGFVAGKDDGLVFPRNIVQVPDTGLFVVADMGGWSPGLGRLLLLDPAAPAGKRLKVLLTKLDFPHGLAVGIDRRIYASTDRQVFRFDPLARQPEKTIEVIVQGLPGRRVALSDKTVINESAHPLKVFVFDKTGRIFVNVGAPTDNCITKGAAGKRCPAGEGADPLAAIWAFTPPAGGIFKALKPGEANPPREIYARGLRNSMALAVHPDFPAEGAAFLQGENGRDLPDIFEPNEELNAIEKGRHYGWPYCYDLATTSPEFKAFLEARTEYHRLCTDAQIYRQPLSLVPPHSAPLGMFYYQGGKFPELQGKLVVGLHGYRPTGSRVIFYDVDAKGFPRVSPAPVTYGVNCAAAPTRAFQTETAGQAGAQVAAAPFHELISGWYKVNGVRPQGAPVGMTVAADGAIWLVEDKNQAIMRIDVAPAGAVEEPRCDARTEAQIEELIGFVAKSAASARRLAEVRSQLIESHCLGCHSDFDIKPGMSDAQKDRAALHFLLGQDQWIYPGDPESGRMHERVWGRGAERVMPPDGAALTKDRSYRAILATLDGLVANMVPGERRRLRLGQRVQLSIVGRGGKVCGTLSNDTVVVVVDRSPKEKPSFSRIYRPADHHLNGDCVDGDGYYVEQKYLGAV
jgi:glucose/arabinose dehydrogenase